jgi:transposase
MYRVKCRRCNSIKVLKIRRGKVRCKICKYEFKPRIGRINLNYSQWKKVIYWFLRSQSINVIIEETKISKYKILKSLNLVREIMAKDIPEIFEGIVEVDETYLGGQKKNKRKSQLKKEKEKFGRSKRGLGTKKQPLFGILCRNGKVWATIVDDTEAKDLIPIIENKIKKGTRICSDTWRAYTGLATKGYVHRTVKHQKKEYAKGRNHINGLEGFFGYLKRQLSSRGGIRRKRLPLYLAEYVWRYNNRRLKIKQQIKCLLKLIIQRHGF